MEAGNEATSPFVFALFLIGFGAMSPALACTGPGPAPTATIGSPSAVCVNAQVNFTANNSIDIDWDHGLVTDCAPVRSFYWQFGDGNTSTDQNPSHTYTQAGNYTVRLTVDDSVNGQYPGQYSNDSPNTISKSLAVVGVASVNGPSNGLCPGETGVFTATTNPPGYGNMVQWSGGGHPATGSGTTFATYWTACGDKTVFAGCGSNSVSTNCRVGATPGPVIVGGSVSPANDYVCANCTVGNVYDNYCTDAMPQSIRWSVPDAQDVDSKGTENIYDDLCIDLTYDGATWIGSYLKWTTPNVYSIHATVNDKGTCDYTLGKCAADDPGSATAEIGRVTVIGGTIEPHDEEDDDWQKLDVWCPASANASHRKMFKRVDGQPYGTNYLWEITSGATKAQIFGSATGPTVIVEPVAPSSSPGDVTLRLTYSYSGLQCTSNIPLTVCRPDPGHSRYDQPPMQFLCNTTSRYVGTEDNISTGVLVTYTFRDQFGGLMQNGRAYWDERIIPNIGGTGGSSSDGNGQATDYHYIITDSYTTCGWLPCDHLQLDQRITVNGWASGVCADEDWFPAFWRFTIDFWTFENDIPPDTTPESAWVEVHPSQ